VVKYG